MYIDFIRADARARDPTTDDRAARSRSGRELTVDGLGPGDRIEHADGRTWRIVAASPRTVRVLMPDGRRSWIPRDSLRRQLRDEPVSFVPNPRL
ncbi:hypothetical protein ACFQPA_21550 [Halomarina halobia]|uniref:Uncharacterized protein n=1 Tax=Halomarina halobia TaxID=3033386 RepID=A0ABD6AG17_9EURY|nr:hypothetical protein [Halomarina sp. PSR21]